MSPLRSEGTVAKLHPGYDLIAKDPFQGVGADRVAYRRTRARQLRSLEPISQYRPLNDGPAGWISRNQTLAMGTIHRSPRTHGGAGGEAGRAKLGSLSRQLTEPGGNLPNVRYGS